MITLSKTWLGITLVVLIGWLLYLLSPILTPFFVAALLAYLGNPLVESLTSLHLPRTLSAVIVFILFLLLIIVMLGLLVPMLEKQIVLLNAKLPEIISWIQTVVMPWLKKHFGIQHFLDVSQWKILISKHWTQAGSVAKWLWTAVSSSGAVIFALFANLLLVPVVTFYLLRDWKKVIAGLKGILPPRIEPTATKLALECHEVLGAFFRGQLMVMFGLAIIYALGLSIIGLHLAILIGLVAGLVSIVPYLGFIVGIASASIAAIIQFHSLLPVLYVAIVFIIAQAIEGMVLTPLLVGDRIGLHPVAVIFAILAGGQVFGFFGILLALPVAAVIMVLLRALKMHLFDTTSVSGSVS